MISGITEGIGYYPEAISLVSKHKLWKYMIIPGLISVVLSGIIVAVVWGLKTPIGDWLSNQYPFEFGKEAVVGIAGWLSILIVLILIFYLFKYLVMAIIAPFMGTLSERVETIKTGRPAPEVSFGQLVQDVLRGLRIALRNVVREILLTLLILILFNFIPLVGTLAIPVATFIVQAYYAGFGNLDYTLERKRFNVSNSVAFTRAHRGFTIGNGAVFVLLMFIPVLGWFLAPGYGTVAATLGALKRLDE